MAQQIGAYPGCCSMKRPGVFLLPPGWEASQVNPSINLAGTHLCNWVERGTARVKCLPQEHNTMSPARAPTQTARSGDERTNHEATTPPPDQNTGAVGNIYKPHLLSSAEGLYSLLIPD